MKIPYRILGKTNLKVSALSVGTVALGISYGIQAGNGKPKHSHSIELLQKAAEVGINLFDTAPNYGDAETLIGEALSQENRAIFATKVSLPSASLNIDINDLRNTLRESLDQSRRALKRDVLDIVQVHNLSIEHATNPAIGCLLKEFQVDGTIRHLGASVYSEDEAVCALESGWVDVIQVAHNLLDQRMATRVFDMANKSNVGVLTRSAFLKGALTPRARLLPPELSELRTAVEVLANSFGMMLEQMPVTALEFCLGEPRIHSVLIGPTHENELDQALEALNVDRWETMHAIGVEYAINTPRLVDPRQWPLI